MRSQSTSDQERYEKYPPIAAAAPIAMLPEQGGNRAHPQPEMDDREILFTLANGFLGRLYLSGHLDGMNAHQLHLIAGAIRNYKEIRPVIARSTPFWPLGVPQWDASWTALGLEADGEALIGAWRRGGDRSQVFPVPVGLRGRVEEWDIVVGDPEHWRIRPASAGIELTALAELPCAVVLRGRSPR
ncbi:hypothetical protein [Leifsonia sp. AG29]|uniref:hypothetical protein n=1 Tax=Leifsonia sp. AG29 TaxID=2598860 RepID=UPI00131C9893|nr:hypothetical protein [Leifsonia sp. AG29]